MAIDDLANRPHDCDLLLDQNLIENQYCRYDGLVGDDCVRLLGPRYALLQPEYVDLHFRAALRIPPVRRVFAYFGAADVGNLSGRVIRAFSSVAEPDVSLDVVVAPSSPFWPGLRELAEIDSRVRLHGQIPSLAPLLCQADVAIGAGGTTSWERCCLGVPAYVITLAENQVAGTRALEQQGAVRWLGNAWEITDPMLFDSIREALEGRRLSAMSESSLPLVDGMGTARVTESMLDGAEMKFVVRPLCPADERLTLDWANDPDVRKNSFSPDFIEVTTHRCWLASRLVDTEKCRFYVVETTKGLPAGAVRFECISPAAWEVHYSMDRCLRGRGKGTPFLLAALDYFRLSVESGTKVIGRVKQGNLASQHIFRNLGFSESPDGQDFKYQLVLKR